jgi:hypothetical protein
MSSLPPAIPSAADRAARQMTMLRELAELGMELARALGAQALAELSPEETPDAPKVTPADPVLMFTRVARAVRQTVALEMRIGRADAEDQAEDDRALHRYEQIARRVLVHEIAADAVTMHAEDGRRERLLRELDDRLDAERPDDANYSYLPVNVLVTRICRDLGVQPDWSLWAERAIVADEDGDWPPGHPGMRRPPQAAEPRPYPDASPP